MKPYRTEWRIYHEELLLAGSLDMLYELEDGTYFIADWKRSKEINTTHKYEKYPKFSSIEGLESIPDTNYWHYAIQLNLYRMILQEKYQKVISKMAIIIMHPNQDNYQMLDIPAMNSEIEIIKKNRLTWLKGGDTLITRI